MRVARLLETGAAPVIAILRGLPPDDAVAIGGALIAAGIRILEVPLNSPEPLVSIARLHQHYAEDALIGAGTVLSSGAVDAVERAGGRLIVSPHADERVIKRSIELGLEPLPGFMTATEAFHAVAAGAAHLKLFPANSLGRTHIRAIRDVLPAGIDVWAVGGTGAHDIAQWIAAGARGIAVGGSLYKPGDSAEVVGRRGREILAAWNDIPRTPAGARTPA